MAELWLDVEETQKGALPPTCMICGENANHTVNRKFSWTPSWVGFLILAGAVPYVIVAAILTKNMRVQVPTCDQHRNHWSWRAWAAGLSFGVLVLWVAAAIGLLIYLEQQHHDGPIFGLLIMSMPGLFIAWLIFFVVLQQTAIQPNEITDDSITLCRVNQTFIDHVEDVRDQAEAAWRERRARRKAKRP